MSTSFPITPVRAVTPELLRESTTRAADHLAGRLDEIDPASLAVLDYLARRWSWPQLAPAGPLARALVEAGDHRGGTTVVDRLVVADAQPPTAAQRRAATPIERMLARVLTCTPATAPALRAAIERRSRLGGYETTHAAWALGLLAERCPVGVGRTRKVIVDRLTRELRERSAPDDLMLEQMAMLGYLGAAPRVPDSAVRAALGAQAPDGGWGEEPGGEPSWHPTMLALWAISGLREPGAPVPFAPG